VALAGESKARSTRPDRSSHRQSRGTAAVFVRRRVELLDHREEVGEELAVS